MERKLTKNLEEYKRFRGKYNEQMPLLLKDERHAITTSEAAKQRLEALASNADELIHLWWNKAITTADGIFYHPNGKIKIVKNSTILTNINIETPLENGKIKLYENKDETIQTYKKLQGAEFTKKDIKKYTGHFETKKDAKHNPIIAAIIPDKHLREEYIKTTFTLGKKIFGYEKMMKLEIAKPNNICTGTAILLDTITYDSDLICNSALDINHRGTLIGKKQKKTSLNFTNPTLEYESMTKKYK